MVKIEKHLANIFAHIKNILVQNKSVIKIDDYILIKISDGIKSPKKLMEENVMSKNKIVVPEAKKAMENFKMEAANEVGVNLKNGYNGDLTSKQAGSIGGQMVNNICPVRNMNFDRNYRWLDGHLKTIGYTYKIVI